MTAAIWTLFAVLLSIWTGVVWLATELTRWTSQALEEGTLVGAADLPSVIGHMPDWLIAWIPSDVLPDVLAGIRSATQLLEVSLPWAGAAVGWLVAVAWVAWFLVALVLTITAFILHVIVRRSSVHIMPRSV